MSRDAIVAALQQQIRACELLGSPLMAALLQGALSDYRVNGMTADLISVWRGDPGVDTLCCG